MESDQVLLVVREEATVEVPRPESPVEGLRLEFGHPFAQRWMRTRTSASLPNAMFCGLNR